MNNQNIESKKILVIGSDSKIAEYLLKKISTISFDNTNFPKSRSLRQLVFYLKYFILIREFLKESLNDIPEYLNEIIYYIGKAYNFSWGSTKESLLFNGNHDSDLSDFDKYLSLYKYKFISDKHELGGYSILKNKKGTVFNSHDDLIKSISKNYLHFDIILIMTNKNSRNIYEPLRDIIEAN